MALEPLIIELESKLRLGDEPISRLGSAQKAPSGGAALPLWRKYPDMEKLGIRFGSCIGATQLTGTFRKTLG